MCNVWETPTSTKLLCSWHAMANLVNLVKLANLVKLVNFFNLSMALDKVKSSCQSGWHDLVIRMVTPDICQKYHIVYVEGKLQISGLPILPSSAIWIPSLTSDLSIEWGRWLWGGAGLLSACVQIFTLHPNPNLNPYPNSIIHLLKRMIHTAI